MRIIFCVICCKDADGAKEYFQRRLTYVTSQIEKIQAIGSERQRIRDGKTPNWPIFPAHHIASRVELTRSFIFSYCQYDSSENSDPSSATNI